MSTRAHTRIARPTVAGPFYDASAAAVHSAPCRSPCLVARVANPDASEGCRRLQAMRCFPAEPCDQYELNVRCNVLSSAFVSSSSAVGRPITAGRRAKTTH